MVHCYVHDCDGVYCHHCRHDWHHQRDQVCCVYADPAEHGTVRGPWRLSHHLWLSTQVGKREQIRMILTTIYPPGRSQTASAQTSSTTTTWSSAQMTTSQRILARYEERFLGKYLIILIAWEDSSLRIFLVALFRSRFFSDTFCHYFVLPLPC